MNLSYQANQINKQIEKNQSFRPILINKTQKQELTDIFNLFNLEGYWKNDEYLLANYLIEEFGVKSYILAEIK